MLLSLNMCFTCTAASKRVPMTYQPKTILRPSFNKVACNKAETPWLQPCYNCCMVCGPVPLICGCVFWADTFSPILGRTDRMKQYILQWNLLNSNSTLNFSKFILFISWIFEALKRPGHIFCFITFWLSWALISWIVPSMFKLTGLHCMYVGSD